MADEVDLWFAHPADLDDPTCQAAAWALLDTGERERLGRYRFERDRRLYLTAHALLRRTLSRHAAIDPALWRFGIESNGRPVLAGPSSAPRLRFNLSHCAGLVACAVTHDREVGVDVEPVSDLPHDLIQEIMGSLEAAALRALPVDMQAERFFTLWTLKESYVKARGLGIGLPLDQVAFELDADTAPRFEPGAGLADGRSAWTFARLRPTPMHCAAVCVASPTGAAAVQIIPRWASWP